MTTQPQLSGWLPSDPVFQEPEAEKMEGPVSPSWDHSVAQDWAPGTALAIPRAPRHSQVHTWKAWPIPHLLLQMGLSLNRSWASHKPQPRAATWTMNPTQVSPRSQSMW